MAAPRKPNAPPPAWQLLFARAEDPAFVLDPATARILAANKAAVDFLGAGEDDLRQTLWTDWIERVAADATMSEAEASAPSPFPGAMAFPVLHRARQRPPVRGMAAWAAIEWAGGPAVLSLHQVPARPVTPPPVVAPANRWVSADVKALGETAARLNAATSPDDCGLEVLRRIGQTLGRGEVRLLLADSQGHLVSTLSYTSSDSSSTEPPIRLAMADSIAARVADTGNTTGRPWFVMAPEDLPPAWRRLAPMVVMPVATAGSVAGLVTATMSPIPASPEDYARCDAASALASMLAATLRRLGLQGDLRRQQEKHHSLLRTIDAVSWLMDLETLAPRYVSPQVERVFGRHAHEFYEDPPLWMDVVHSDDRAEVEAWFGDVARGHREALEYRIRRPDGQIAWVSALARLAEPDERRARPMLDGLLTDITQRREADEALRLEARRNASLVAAIGQLVYEHVIASGEMRWEGPVERVLGCSREELGFDTAGWLHRLHPDDRDRALEEFNWAFDYNRPYDLTYRLLRGDGSYVWLHDRGIPHFDEHMRRERRIGVLTDITEQRTAAERQQQIEQRLQQAQRLESIGLLASGVAHDFNNLLAGILGHLGLVLMEVGIDSPLRSSLELAEAGTLRASELTRQLLLLAGRGELSRSRIQIPRLVTEIAELLRSTIASGIDLHLALPADLPAVVGDASQLRQVILNLITNASQSIRKPPGLITIEATTEELHPVAPPQGLVGSATLAGRFVAIRVRDTGCGIPAGIRDRIFDPFFSTRREGHGLGLAAVLGILKAHHGAICVESQPDVGTTMTVLLPVEQAGTSAALSGSTPPPSWGPASHALVYDSSPHFREFLVELLRRMGITGHAVESWVEAQPVLDGWAVGIALLEEQAVRRQSTGALAEIQALMQRVPTVLLKDGTLSGSPLGDTLSGMAVASVVKPLSARALIETISQVLSAAKRQHPPDAAPPAETQS